MQEWISKIAFDITTKYFHKWYGLLAATFLLFIIALSIYGLIPPKEIEFKFYILAVSITSLLLFIYWWFFSFHYPKRSKNRLGFVVAVCVEEHNDYNFFKRDFLHPLKNKIADLDLPFDVLPLRNHQSEKVETINDVRQLLKKTNAQFCIWGSIKKRKTSPGESKYIFTLRGVVVHKPIKEVQKILLTKEFDKLLPSTIDFEENIQFEGFKVISDQVFVALDYISGRAALLSGDFNTAIQLHEPLLKAIQNGLKYPLSKEELMKILSLEYDIKATLEYFNSNENYKESIYKSLFYNKKNYGALLKKAIAEFDNGKGNAQSALNTIRSAEQNSQGRYDWLYSEAFLHFWQEDYENALKCCKKLKKKSYNGEEITVKEVIYFIENLLKKENKPQLKYWMGFVCYIKDNNPALADKFFQEFIDEAGSTTSMNDLLSRAKSYLVEIKREIGY